MIKKEYFCTWFQKQSELLKFLNTNHDINIVSTDYDSHDEYKRFRILYYRNIEIQDNSHLL